MILVILGIGALVIVTHLWVNILSDEKYRDDANYCYGCPCGWCDFLPGDEECKKWREENVKNTV